MKLNAINAVNSAINCQPLKNVAFSKKQAPEAAPEGSDRNYPAH